MRIAIIKLSSLGDIVNSVIGLQFIKRAYPEAKIDWIVEECFAEVLNYNPDIHEVLTVNLRSLKKNKLNIFKEIAKVRKYANRNYDLVIDAQGLIKSAIVSKLLCSVSYGFDRNSIREKLAAFFYRHTIQYPYDANIVERNLAVLLRPLGLNFSVDDVLNKKTCLFYQSDNRLNKYFVLGEKSVLFVIGSSWSSKNYPKEQYLEVIRGLDVNSLICWGTEAERETAEWISERSNAEVLPKLSLNELKEVVARVDLVVGNDTGPTHIAWAMNCPSIMLFGPTPISLTYQTNINKVLKSSSIVDKFKLDKNDFSIKDIEAGQVLACARGLLAE